MAHTPGPWRYHAAESTNYETFAVTGSNENGGSVLPILAMTYNWPNSQEDNARLIAAAPELLEALEELTELCEERGLWPVNVSSTKLKIAKARGA